MLRRLPSRDPGYRKRIGIALALALALHEVAAGLWPRSPASPAKEAIVVAQLISIRRRPRPTPPPTPRPTARPTPAPHYTLAPVFEVRAPAAKAAATPHARLGGAAAHKRVVHVHPRPVHAPAPPVSLAAGTHAGRQNGGTGMGAGAGNGTSGLAGTSSGTASRGTGNGGDTNSAPCADVYILPGRVDYTPAGTVLQHVYAKIVLRSGDVQLGTFPYPFRYDSEKRNPFVHDDQLSADRGVAVQPPPAGSDVTTMPPVVQFVLAHTNPDTGFTLLPECTPDESSPAPSP